MSTHVERFVAEATAWYDRQTSEHLHTMYAGAWDANDSDSATNVLDALRRRGEDVSRYRWGNRDYDNQKGT